MGRIDLGGSLDTMAWKSLENHSDHNEFNSGPEHISRHPDSNGVEYTQM